MTTEKRKNVLFFEERVAITRKMLNEISPKLTDDPVLKAFFLQCISVLDGEREMVPWGFRHIARRP